MDQAGNDRLQETELSLALDALTEWVRTGEVIQRTFTFPDFRASMAFVNAVADAAESAGHHPDILIRWGKVTVSLTTHDAGGLTQRDVDLAGVVDGLA